MEKMKMNRKNIKKRPLADTVLSGLESEEKEYRELDGNNLYFRVQPSGKKSWQLRYKNADKKWSWLGLGSYPLVSAAAARAKAADLQLQLSKGLQIKNNLEKKEEVIKQEAKFGNLMIAWLDTRQNRWNKVTYEKAVKSINKHIMPAFGHKNATEITSDHWFGFFLDLQRNLGIFNQVAKLVSYCRSTYDLAKFRGKLEVNPLEGINQHLQVYKKGSMDYVHFFELPELLSKIREYPKREIAIALELLVLLYPRPSELRLAKWDQFDFERKVWIRPSTVMKNGVSHAIPLPEQAIQLLIELREVNHLSDLLFPSRTSLLEPISDNTFNMALKRMGYKGRQDPHGFRHIASTKLNDQFSDRPQVIEASLSHLKPGVKGIYDTGAHYEERIGMMQWWANEVYSL